MKVLAVLFGLVAVSGAVAQEDVARSAPQTQVVVVGSGCPVAMRAERQPSGQLLRAGGAMRVPGSGGASVSLVLVAPAGKVFARVEVEVLYRVPQAGLQAAEVRLERQTPGSPFRSRRFTLEQAAGAARVETRLSVGEVGTITRVRLVSATYGDGSALEDGAGCSVRPSGLMLVGKG